MASRIKLSLDSETSSASRNTFVGLNGGFGTVLIGRHDTPEKMSTGKLDLFADSVGDYNLSGTILGTRETERACQHFPQLRRPDSCCRYDCWQKNIGANADRDGIADRWSAAAMYENGPLYVGAGYPR